MTMAYASSLARLSHRHQSGGCDFLEDPSLEASAAKIFWDEAIDHSVLPTVAHPDESGTGFELRSLSEIAVVLDSEDGQRVSFTDGYSRFGLHMMDGTLLAGPVKLSFLIDEDRATAQLATLERFRSLRTRKLFGLWLHRPESKSPRWIRQLRAFDGRAAGASEREIASALFGYSRAQEQWRDRDGSLRSAVRRLLSVARHNVRTGYRDLLLGR